MNPRLERHRNPALFISSVLVALSGLAGCGALSPSTPEHHRPHQNGSSSVPVAEAPPLFPDQQAATVDTVIDGQAAAAQQLMSGWWSDHGTKQHDKQFVKWLKKSAPEPPKVAVRQGELAGLRRLAAQRTPQGEQAAKWLDDNGKDVAWTDIASATEGSDASDDGALTDLLDMANRVSDDLKEKFAQPSPYVLDPSLNDGQDPKSSHNHCTCSYPSGHAMASAAATTYLSGVDRTHAANFKKFRDQVDFSRMYTAGHIPSDLAAGTLLGDAIGEYFLVTRHGASQ